jgi:hypothetical protein
LYEIVKDLNEGLRVQGYLEFVETLWNTTFFWKAEKGKFLTWLESPLLAAVEGEQ